MKSIVLILVSLLVTVSVQAEKDVTLGNGEWRPWTSKELPHYGIASRIVTEAFALEGYRTIHNFYPWKRAFILTRRAEVDASFPWAMDEERLASFYFSKPMITDTVVFYHRRDFSFDWNDFEDLKGLNIVGTLGYSYGKEFDAAVQSYKLQVQRVSNEFSSLKMLLNGRVHLAIMNRTVASTLLQERFTEEQRALIVPHPKPLDSSHYFLIIGRKNPRASELISAFNRGMQRLQVNGKLGQYLQEIGL